MAVQEQTGKMPTGLFWAPAVYLVTLTVSAVFWSHISNWKVVGVVPLSILWAGTLGGVIASLQGIFFYNKNWNKSYDAWHVFSGAIGAAFGIVSYLFLQVTVTAAGGSSSSANLFILAAFTLGYGQKQFHSLMNEIFTLVFHPHNDSASVGSEVIDVTLQIRSEKGQFDIKQTKQGSH